MVMIWQEHVSQSKLYPDVARLACPALQKGAARAQKATSAGERVLSSREKQRRYIQARWSFWQHRRDSTGWPQQPSSVAKTD